MNASFRSFACNLHSMMHIKSLCTALLHFNHFSYQCIVNIFTSGDLIFLLAGRREQVRGGGRAGRLLGLVRVRRLRVPVAARPQAGVSRYLSTISIISITSRFAYTPSLLYWFDGTNNRGRMLQQEVARCARNVSK